LLTFETSTNVDVQREKILKGKQTTPHK